MLRHSISPESKSDGWPARSHAPAKYATDLDAAKADGYGLTITQMIPDMGHHFLNPNITDFDVTKPPIPRLRARW
jgi:hypothetical protein